MALDLWVYVNLFPPPLWAVFFATLALLGCCWNLIELSGISKLHGDSDSEPFSCVNGLGVVGLLLFQLDYPTLKKNILSSKILFIFSAILYYVLFESYAGDLTAYMASGDYQNEWLEQVELLYAYFFTLTISNLRSTISKN